MDFSERIEALALKVKKSVDVIPNEEGTKQAFIIPFIMALDYDV